MIKNHTQGFTLLELLIVILIIGVLAAIALPQYKMAVGKTKFATLKNITKSLAESVNRFYMIHDAYPESYQDLDIDFSVTQPNSGTIFYPKETHYCNFWRDNNQMAACYKYISGKLTGYYVLYNGGKPKDCYTNSIDETHITNKICKQETKQENGNCSSGKYCTYRY